ncbi:MAG: autotransporter outer membrane beta-barrel domain-containing protein [Alphaproteobacteria bacterium]|nr:autotransporter outer membrane beta-barrel domain-containing protein [Alphaproteobacteria bacterium]
MSKNNILRFKHSLRATSALFGVAAAAALLSQPAHAIVGNDNYTPAQLVDPTNITGVGQMVVDEQNGFIGLCTATLINPRTVIFASHCVNETPDETAFQPNTAYGSAFGGLPIGFFFNANNNQSGNSAIGHWLNGISGGPKDLTRPQDYAYNSNYVVYDTNCCTLGVGNNFLQSDIAMAALDTPVTGIPTWTLLFSPLSGPTHATIVGYGINGTGTTGASGGIDYRRRVAENTISVLGSLDDQDTFLFGSPDGLPQNLYMMDFNDPLYGTAQANAYDFNIFHDAALQKEGITAPGDSGGPLIVDQLFSTPVIAAVLSGGDRFYYGQPSSSYGTTSFYQPLYLFWDWIIANNPYKYVSAKAGNGDWFDPNHWVMNLNPNYVTIVNGQLVNALPTTPAQGTPTGSSVNAPKFGNVCFYNDCVDIATGVETIYPTSASLTTNTLSGGPALVAASALLNSAVADTGNAPSSDQMYAMLASRGFTMSTAATPAEGSATVGGEVVQGAPGSSNFVPNDTNGNPATNSPARYYDVTLWQAGTTTLDNNTAIVDRLTINGAQTGLTIGPNGNLASLIDTTMYAGNFRVDGQYVSIGDIALMGGVLSGSGSVTAPYTTAVLGAIAPGTVGTTGNLTVWGNVILSSGSGLLIDMSPTAIDRLDVYGQLSLGGTAVFTPVGGFVPQYKATGIFATGDTITGSFDHVPDTIPGVLYPAVSVVTVGSGASAYQEAVVTMDAATFASQLTNATTDQLQIGNALDTARGTNYNDLIALFDAIDPLSGGTLSTALENLAPDNARALPLVSNMMLQGFTGFLWQHLGEMAPQNSGDSTFHVQTSALQLAQNSSVGSLQTRDLLAGLGQFDSGPASSPYAASPTPAQTTSAGGAIDLPKGMGGFLSGSSLDGSVVTGGGGGKANVDGFVVSGGIDLPLSDHFRAGVALALAQGSAVLRNTPSTTNTNSTQGVVYGRYDGNDWFASGYAGSSVQAIRTRRDVVVGATTFHLAGHTDGSAPAFGLQVGKYYDLSGVRLAPAVGLEFQRSEVGKYTETGGAAAMTVDGYAEREFDLRAGVDAYGSVQIGSTLLKPMLHAFVVDNAAGTSGTVQTNFVNAPSAVMSFAMAQHGGAWAELGIGAEVDVSDNATLSAHYDANVGRADSQYGAWTGSLRIRF